MHRGGSVLLAAVTGAEAMLPVAQPGAGSVWQTAVHVQEPEHAWKSSWIQVGGRGCGGGFPELRRASA